MNRSRVACSLGRAQTGRTAIVPALVSALGLALAVVAAGCGPGQQASSPDAAAGDEMAGGHGDEAVDFGEPGEASESSRVIEIQMLDTMRYDPMEIGANVGETVTFRVTNPAALAHEFLLDYHDEQIAHETEMPAAGGVMKDQPNGFMVQPGETKEIVWKFTKAGEVEYACHVLGHYPAGMVGKVTVK